MGSNDEAMLVEVGYNVHSDSLSWSGDFECIHSGGSSFVSTFGCGNFAVITDSVIAKGKLSVQPETVVAGQ